MHHAVPGGAVGDGLLVAHAQRVDVAAHGHSRSRRRGGRLGDKAPSGSGDSVGNPCLGEQLGKVTGGLELLAARLGMGVEVTAYRNQMVRHAVDVSVDGVPPVGHLRNGFLGNGSLHAGMRVGMALRPIIVHF